MGYRETRHWVHGLFEVEAGGRLGWYVDYFIIGLIVANVLAVMLETVDVLYVTYRWEFFGFETVSVAIFTVEYLARLWSATEHPEYRHPVRGRLRYAASPYMLIDLLAILPFYVATLGMGSLRALRALRFLRLLKLTRYSESVDQFIAVLRLKREQLAVSSIVGTILLLLSSSMVYFAERGAQPDEFSSIPAALWWGVITMTTVGYGDVTPVTTLGRALGSIIAVLGVGMFALPASILAAGFVEAGRGRVVECPHCHEEILEEDVEGVSE